MPVQDYIKKMMFAHQIDFQEGRFEMFDIRGVILPAFTLMKFIEEMYKEKGDAVFDILYETGREHGRLGIEQIGERHKIPKREFFSKVFESGNIMGLGKAEIEYFNPDKPDLGIKLTDSPLDEQFKESEVLSEVDRPVNEFLRGVFTEMADSVIEEDVRMEQSACEYLGDRYCAFELVVEE